MGSRPREALARVYRAFEVHRAPSRWDAAPGRDAVGILRTLTSVPLLDLTADQLGPYAGWALTTVGDAEAYLHFLPRILELAACDMGYLGFDPAVIAGKLLRCAWTDWPPERCNVVANVFEAVAFAAIEVPPEEEQTAPQWLCGMLILKRPVAKLLAAWRQSPTADAALQLAAFVGMDLDALGAADRDARFWANVDAASRRDLQTWLASPATSEQLQAARVAPRDHWQIDNALKRLRAAQTN
ncbi:MAG TPA: hypothetical protein VHZ78_09800 [Rhizomicrobium sp.]|jgi:hypothetical protein|nr:hypothetical protein [Rhizomicrobium sp.]